MEEYTNYLVHYGVKGMKWRRRKGGSQYELSKDRLYRRKIGTNNWEETPGAGASMQRMKNRVKTTYSITKSNPNWNNKPIHKVIRAQMKIKSASQKYKRARNKGVAFLKRFTTGR